MKKFSKLAGVTATVMAAAMVLSCTVCVSAAEDETIKLTVWGAEEDQNLLKELTDKFQEKYADHLIFRLE